GDQRCLVVIWRYACEVGSRQNPGLHPIRRGFLRQFVLVFDPRLSNNDPSTFHASYLRGL
ncbi:MAG: hypothetical protein EBU26_12955, partial [Verrucomicrobia bacterium]|nr:hypothetical protein [Verrucomicrobiota bacterium]